MALKKRNNRGVFTTQVGILITKQLRAKADEVGIRIRPIIRDELEESLRQNIYNSYTPATEKGKAIKKYNEKQKHQIKHPYHHTGKLASSIYCVIDGNTVIAKLKPKKYSNGKTTSEIYDLLKKGTRPLRPDGLSPEGKKGYRYNNGEKFSRYIQQEPHNFEQKTLAELDIFINKVISDFNSNNIKGYEQKYKKSDKRLYK